MADRARAARERFDRPELAPLWRALRERMERSPGPVRRVRIAGLTVEQRTALADLMGWGRSPGDAATISVDRLDAVLLRSPVGLDARGVVEAVAGPLRDRAGERRSRDAARAELWEWVANHPSLRAEPALQAWVDYARRGGLVDHSLEATRRLMEGALAVLDALPGQGEPLPTFAERVCGDTHALDDGRRLSAYVLRALACLQGREPPSSADERRALWQWAGLECDALSTSVLVAGLRPAGAGPLARSARLWTEASQALRLTLAQLRADPLTRCAARRVWVVENPSVVAHALDRFGAGCPPLACTSGWPNVAVIELLRQVAAAGAALHCHADLDGEGLRIAAYVTAKTGAGPWRMTARDYLAAVPATGAGAGRVSEAPWDAALAEALASRGVAVPEERVVETLLADLSRSC